MEQNEWNGVRCVTYWTTRFVKGGTTTKRTPCLYIPREWGLEKGDIVDIVLYKAEDLKAPPIYATVRIGMINKSMVIYMKREWGLAPDDFVTLKLRVRPMYGDA